MQLTFLGGADEVGASGTLVEIAGRRVLIDAGIRPSPRARYGLTGDQLPDLSVIDRAGGVDAILVTHAHLDHSGCLELVTDRYDCPVYATPATVALIRVLHRDSRRIMESRMEEEGELPLFDDLSVQKLLDAFIPAPFRSRIMIGEGVVATLYPAGHVAGAAMVYLESDEGSVLVSGDLSVSPQRTVEGLTPPRIVPDLLLLESTYGGRLHANRAAEERRLVDRVAEVTAAGGKVLIPAFALGRAQEVLLTLRAFRRQGELPNVSIWADGMVRAICQVYRQFPDALHPDLQEQGAEFFDQQVRPVLRAEQRNLLAEAAEPLVIVSSSGMLAGGPSVLYARHLAGRPENAILLTGYQDEEAPGRWLQKLAQEGRGTLKLGEEKVDVRCHVSRYALSAHADEGQLVSLVEALDLPRVVLVHGEPAARESLAQALSVRGRIVLRPLSGQTIAVRLRRPRPLRPLREIGQGQPLDLRRLWLAVGDPGGGEFGAEELARIWWGEEERAKEIVAAVEEDDLYFTPHPTRPGLYRARSRPQIEVTLARRERMAALPDLEGRLLLIRDPDGEVRPAVGARKGGDRFWVRGREESCLPDDLLEVLGPAGPVTPEAVLEAAASLEASDLLPVNTPRPLEALAEEADLAGPALLRRAATALALLRAGAHRTDEGYLFPRTLMEPNQALALVQELFPTEARLQRCGYHRDQGTIVLTFDFPDVAAERYTDLIAQAEEATGWTVRVKPEANQLALRLLAEECLPAGWQIVKGPSIRREEREVAITVRGEGEPDALEEAARAFCRESGFALVIGVAAGAPAPEPSAAGPAGERWEINAAYGEIRGALAGSTLYKTSLKGDRIVLSFITPEVGARYQNEIVSLSRRIGWPLEINPNPNQVAIAAEARALVASVGATILRGPGIFVGRREVVVRLAGPLDEGTRAHLERAFEERTGYRLVVE